MDNKVIFECQYHSDNSFAEPGMSCIAEIIYVVCMAAMAFSFEIEIGLMFWLPLVTAVLLTVYLLHRREMWRGRKLKIQVTEKKLQIVSEDGTVVQAFDLRDITTIYMNAAGIMVKVPSDPFAEDNTVWGVYTLSGAEDGGGIVVAAKQQIEKLKQAEKPVQEAEPAHPVPAAEPVPEMPQRALTEEETDALHAAQHLLNQGMISEQQYSGVFAPPVQQPLPLTAEDINAMNAADYQQRQEMLAQQLGTTQTEE